MTDVVIVILLLVFIEVGLKEMIKHLKGEGACCGGATSRPKKKKLNNKILYRYVFRIEGMHCQNCANAVTRAVNDMDGAKAKMYLRKKTVKVFCDREINIEQIKNVIEEKGYTVYLK